MSFIGNSTIVLKRNMILPTRNLNKIIVCWNNTIILMEYTALVARKIIKMCVNEVWNDTIQMFYNYEYHKQYTLIDNYLDSLYKGNPVIFNIMKVIIIIIIINIMMVIIIINVDVDDDDDDDIIITSPINENDKYNMIFKRKVNESRDSFEVKLILKISDIEDVLTDRLYNDPDNLAYEDYRWTLPLIEEKCIQMGIPVKYSTDRRKFFAYVIRMQEMLDKIEKIVEPFHTSDYGDEDEDQDYEEEDQDYEEEDQDYEEEDQDYEEEDDNGEKEDTGDEEYEKYEEDEKYAEDEDDEDDEEDEDPVEDYFSTYNMNFISDIIQMVNNTNDLSFFYECPKSTSLENQLNINGLSFSYENDVTTTGYNISGYITKIELNEE
jgi:hypothetical protein